MRVFLLSLVALLLISSALSQRRRNQGRGGGRQEGGGRARQAVAGRSPLAYVMADGVDEVVGPIQETFSCDNRDYGYYADLANNCQVYHICVPPTHHFSFFCNNGTIFDQKLLTCQRIEEATPCGQQEQFYTINQNFGELDNAKLIYFD